MEHDPAALAAWARGLECKLEQLPQHLHDPARAPWAAWLAQLPTGPARRRVAARLFEQHVAPLPPLDRLSDRDARVALLPRETLLRQLCMLALARRPGVLRCCVDGRTRAGLRSMLGDAFDALVSVGQNGRAPPEHTMRWTPMHWSCQGYYDWAGLLAQGDQALRRIVRLSLPPDLLDVRRAQLPPADLRAAPAVGIMNDLSLEWSC
ncbi:hypothetical protein HLB44_36405 [Aquincola sp. S2]|uniref:Type III secretion protein n=1 Tax=Pseudaquabacterium terrae TaxID=2732868 RepID=A0ABX2EVH4_9BURK|nr:type III secretion protein HrpB4 [Aquabacterium terrae]NRF72446.1 hypothetical protein [Aquabacterium terrae]